MHRRTALFALSALAVAGCSSSDAAPLPPSTVPLAGTLSAPPPTDPPAPPSTATTPTGPPATSRSAPRAPAAALHPYRAIGDQVEGNRLLVLGDSVLASLSSRYGGQLCTDLVWRRWAVEVDAEVGRPVQFGREVLRERMSGGWDAAVVMLGNNYDGDPVTFGTELDALLDELGEIPVVLMTVTRFRPIQDQVNYVIHSTAGRRRNVRLLDWEARTAGEGGNGLLSDDGVHLSDNGRLVLAGLITNALGSAPRGNDGACLPTDFTDDSSGPVIGEPGTIPATTPSRPPGDLPLPALPP